MTEFSSQQSLPNEGFFPHELNHRVNNEFAADIGVVAAARCSNNEVKATLPGVAYLLHRCANVHCALRVPECDVALDAEPYLRQLCLSTGRSYLDHQKIKLVLASEPLRLNADRCRRVGVIVCELIINSARHAFSGGGGEIRVELCRAGALAKCSITDDGSAATMVAAAPGRGLKIIDELSRRIGGRFGLKFGARGSRSIVVFPRRISGETELPVDALRLQSRQVAANDPPIRLRARIRRVEISMCS